MPIPQRYEGLLYRSDMLLDPDGLGRAQRKSVHEPPRASDLAHRRHN